MTRSRIARICAVIAAFVAMTATASPPFFSNHNRAYDNFAAGGSCTDLADGYRCREIVVWERFDVKGTFQFTEATLHSWTYQENPDEGSWQYGDRTLTCPVDQKAISAHQNRVTVDFVIDTEAPGCYQDGFMHTYDPINGEQWVPWAFNPGQRAIAGEWMDPFSYQTGTWNNRDTYHDGWSGMTSTNVNHCKWIWGDLMTRGGFSINQRHYEFEGPEGSAWGVYNVSSCNDNNKQR